MINHEVSCTLKVSIATAYKAVLLAMSDCTVSDKDGIATQNVEETIDHLAINRVQETDHLTIETMYIYRH